MAAWSNLAGTVTGFLRLGLTGVRLKNSVGELAVRNTGDTADAKVQIADGTAANHAVSKGQADAAYAATLLSETTTNALLTSIEFTGLDINTHKGYRLEIAYVDGAATAHSAALYVNGLTTATDYYSQYIQASGTSVTTGRLNSAQAFGATAGNRTFAVIDIGLTPGGFFFAHSEEARTVGSAVEGIGYKISRTASIANITSLTITAGVANGIGVGTTFKIFRGDK